MSLTRNICQLILITILTASGLQRAAAEVMVFAAASLMESLREIGSVYESQTRQAILFNFAGSSTLARQIEEGAPADIFFSADEAQMDRLEKKALVVVGSRRNRLSNTLVIIVAAKNVLNVRSASDLLNPAVRRVALGDPQLVPIGVYARKYLEKIGLWAAVAPKVVPTENVRAALAAVASGNADASIVYRTDAALSPNVSIACSVPLDEGPAIRYPVALLRGSKDPAASKHFLDFLTAEAATGVFNKRGFVVLP